jgi:hypothetical protein
MGKGRETVPARFESLKDYVIDFIGPDRISVKQSVVMMFETFNMLTGKLEFRPSKCGVHPVVPLPQYKNNLLALDPSNTAIKYYEYVE